MFTEFVVRNVKGRDLLGDLGRDVRVVLKCFLNKVWECGLDSVGSG